MLPVTLKFATVKQFRCQVRESAVLRKASIARDDMGFVQCARSNGRHMKRPLRLTRFRWVRAHLWENKKAAEIKKMACLAFLAFALTLWLISGRSWVVFLLLLIPCYACEEWLSEKIFTERSGWSTAESGFSVLRIMYGLILALLLFGAIYGLTLIGRWLF